MCSLVISSIRERERERVRERERERENKTVDLGYVDTRLMKLTSTKCKLFHIKSNEGINSFIICPYLVFFLFELEIRKRRRIEEATVDIGKVDAMTIRMNLHIISHF